MNKIKILGVSKEDTHSYYLIEKKQSFFQGFRKFLLDLGFENNVLIYGFGRPSDKEGEPNESKEDNIEDYVDKQFYFGNQEYKVDVIFGKNKVFMIINSKSDKQEEISQSIQKFCFL